MDTTRDLMRAGLKVAIWNHLDYFAHANYGHRKADKGDEAARTRPDTAVMVWYPGLAITAMPPDAGPARRALRAYFEDVAGRYYGRPPTEDEIAAAMREEPSDDLAPPHGLLLVAQENDDVLGCAGLRLLPGRVAEVTRVFVVPAARRGGLGSRLISCLEEHARRYGVSTLRLDTRRDLVEARRLYARLGYREVPPFSDGPYADYWFEKTLS